MLREIGYCPGIENYSRHLAGRNTGLRVQDPEDLRPGDPIDDEAIADGVDVAPEVEMVEDEEDLDLSGDLPKGADDRGSL